jgi:hypothetical protein
MVFFVGGPKTGTTTGFVVFVDGDMEYGTDPATILEDGNAELAGTEFWTAGAGYLT